MSTTTEERQTRASQRWDRAVLAATKAHRAVDTSRWLLLSSRAVLDRPRPLFRGGGEPLPDHDAVRVRLDALIGGGVLAKKPAGLLWGGRCQTRHGCTICGSSIELGELEFEITSPVRVVIFVHGRCFDLWAHAPWDGDLDR